MASAFTHVVAAATLAAAATPSRALPRLIVVAAVCSVLPDADVIGFRLGIDYADPLGHRGVSHSLAIAAVTAAIATPLLFRGEAWEGLRLRIAGVLFVATASHGLFDAMTDGGLGVAFFWPVDSTRHFLPFRPVAVSPIGVAAFFTERSLDVLRTEAVWIVLPWTLLCALLRIAVRESRP